MLIDGMILMLGIADFVLLVLLLIRDVKPRNVVKAPKPRRIIRKIKKKADTLSPYDQFEKDLAEWEKSLEV